MRRILALFLWSFLFVQPTMLWAKNSAAKQKKTPVAAANSHHPSLTTPSELSAATPYDPSNPPNRLRVLVALGPSSYFLKDGKPHGLEFAMLQGFESELNRRRSKKLPPIRLQFIPVDAGELIPALREGRGDIAAGLMPFNEGLKSLALLTEPYAKDEWCLLSHRDNPLSFDALSQKPLTLSTASLGRRLLSQEDKTVEFNEPAVGVSPEMLLRDIDSNLTIQTLSSRLVFRLWSATYPNLKLGECLNTSVPLVWAVSNTQPALLEDLNKYIASTSRVGIEKAIELTRRFLITGGKVEQSTKVSSMDKLAIFAPVFQAAAAANNLDWLLLAAIGQKESKLMPVIRANGPTGVMQIHPSTARAMGVKDPHSAEGNVSAAAVYLNYLRKMYDREGVSEENQLYFMIAAYNAGEGRLAQLRRTAKAKGLNPNVWVGNVEQIALSSVSKGMVDYVSTVNRYYLAYQAAERAQGKQKKSEPK
ncbi:transglycosylase SLT domain-containing protein [Chitinibacter fontanus]|uniref:Transglycosylase SLT domain-containing protein n=1 Tax=Chitinibacter fontanus TaxID=1737446 RepID=A0A7D5V7V2_9NEIS|nr:transglycosylase SLT domain-containing protein [Chitinibacter fontanus]QLI80319.1 transglycosylase SLT domain-containing protein [Chitinibacter fontanus]